MWDYLNTPQQLRYRYAALNLCFDIGTSWLAVFI